MVALFVFGLPSVLFASDGCGESPRQFAPAHIQVAGVTRDLITVVPPDYSPNLRHRLIIAFHGRTNPAARVRGYYNLEGNLERNSQAPTIFVYPSGLADARGKFTWWVPGQSSNELRAFALFDAIRAKFIEDYCIGEIFLVGHSLGASIVNNLGCARGQHIRAIASVAGGMERPDCAGLVAAMLVHNPNDRLVPVRYGEAARDHLLDYGPYSEMPQPEEFDGLECARHSDASDAFPLLWCLSDVDTTRRGRYYPHQWPAGMGARVMAFFDSLLPAPDHYFSPEVFE